MILYITLLWYNYVNRNGTPNVYTYTTLRDAFIDTKGFHNYTIVKLDLKDMTFSIVEDANNNG